MDIYSYHDFRQFIRDKVEMLRKEQPRLSIREILRRVDCTSPSYYKEVVLDGKKRMSAAVARRFAIFFVLSADETEYLMLLREYNQAKNDVERLHFLDKLISYRKQPSMAHHMLSVHEYGYMAEWHHAVIREILPIIPGFGNRNQAERRALSALLRMRLSDEQIDTSIQLLEKLRFIKRDTSGNYEKTDAAIRMEKKTPAAIKTLSQFMNLAKTAMNTTNSTSRVMKMAILSLNSDAYAIIEKKMNEAFQEIIAVAADSGCEPDRLYAANFQFFPLSRLPEERQE